MLVSLLRCVSDYPLPHCFLSVQLVGMEWKLGVAMSSNYCKSLGSPHVGLQLKVADSDGQPTNHTMEMSIPQFQVVCAYVVGGRGHGCHCVRVTQFSVQHLCMGHIFVLYVFRGK